MDSSYIPGQTSTYKGKLDDFVNYSRDQILEYYAMISDHLPLYIMLFEVEGDSYRVVFANAPTRLSDHFEKAFMLTVDEVYSGRELTNMRDMFQECIQQERAVVREVEVQSGQDNISFWILSTFIPVKDEHGVIRHVLTYSEDITERKIREQNQAQVFLELSTPLLSISDTTVVMPLIGSVDTLRVQHMITTLLNGVATLRAQNVILDITGVPVVDTQVANAIIQAAQSVRLLGARVMICGIRPEVAQVLVNLGVNFSHLPAYASLQSAITATLSMQQGVLTNPVKQ